MNVPESLRHYPCNEYFDSGWALQGLKDEPSQVTLVFPASEIIEFVEVKFLAISKIGEGIYLGYRSNLSGFWSYMSEIKEFALIAPSLIEFVERFYAGREDL